MSPTFDKSSEIQRFECSNAIEICDIKFSMQDSCIDKGLLCDQPSGGSNAGVRVKATSAFVMIILQNSKCSVIVVIELIL